MALPETRHDQSSINLQEIERLTGLGVPDHDAESLVAWSIMEIRSERLTEIVQERLTYLRRTYKVTVSRRVLGQ